MHENALTKDARRLFPEFQRFRDFYLVGGTALALQIGHRISADFDFFSAKRLPSDLLSRVKRVFKRSSLSVTYRSIEQLNLLIDNVKTTFFHYEYSVIDPCITYQRVPVATIREIGAMKAFVIGKRLSYKDYVDWYFLLNGGHVKLDEIIFHARKKFGGDFNDRLFLGQLISFEDVVTQKIDFLNDTPSRRTVEGFLKKNVKNFKL